MTTLYRLACAFERFAQFNPSNTDTVDPYIQQSLNKLGYPVPLKVDAYFGPKTQDAYEWFKDQFNMPQNAPRDAVENLIKSERIKLDGEKGHQNALQKSDFEPLLDPHNYSPTQTKA